MAKKTSAESDEARLKKKVRERIVGSQNPEGDAALRSLHKRLKRAQRKRRRLEIRKRHAMGKKAGAGAKAEAKAEAPASGA
ncbi:MAG: hypothetical protein HY581_03295 [Nitrospirae bacterium]|nr:hypothetical protein [Nitrospirota bacterium]